MMLQEDHDHSQLLIRCPSCGQRFKVDADLRGRTVECGACEHRFRIGDDVVVRAKKFYPGERAALPSRYNRVPIAAPLPEGFQTVHYAEQADFRAFEPTSPLRLIAGAGAVMLVVLIALLLFFGAHSGGALDGMSTVNRMVIAGFAAVIAGALFVYANPRARGRALLGGFLCGLGLLSIPLIRTEGSKPESGGAAISVPVSPHETAAAKDPESERIAELREKYGTDLLVVEQQRLREMGGDFKAYGLFMNGLSEQHKLLVRDYLKRTLKTESPHPLRRQGGYLMLVTKVTLDLERLVDAVKNLGEVIETHPEIGVAEIRVREDAFANAPMEKLSDKENPAFYELNKRELDSIELDRVEKAVVRITDAEPKVYRTDIGRRLVALLAEDEVDFKEEICAALVVWADGTVGAGDPAEALLRKLDEKKSEVPTPLVMLLAKERRSAVVPIVVKLWKSDTSRWEEPLLAFGAAAEPALIAEYPGLDMALRKFAVMLLGRVGGAESLKLLESAREGADSEMKVRIENAGKAIRQRLGQ